MKIKESHWAAVIGVILLTLFTTLLVEKEIGELSFVTATTASMLLSIAVAVLPRLAEFDLRNLRLVLAELKKTKAELEEMYGGIEHIKRVRMRDVNHSDFGMKGGGIITSHSVMNYVMGCMKRERERLARIFVFEKSPDKLAEALLDRTYDTKVFRWVGPGFSLDDPLPQEESPPES